MDTATQQASMGEPIETTVTVNGDEIPVIDGTITVEDNQENAFQEPPTDTCEECGNTVPTGNGWYVVSAGKSGVESGFYCNKCHD